MQAWDVITMSTSAGYRAVKTLAAFWSAVDRTQLSPHDDLLRAPAPGTVAHCLAAPGRQYIVHLHGLALRSAASRTVELRVSGVTKAGVRAVWTDTTSGAATPLAETVANGLNALVAPARGSDSYVLRLEIL